MLEILQTLAGGALGSLVTLITLAFTNKRARRTQRWDRFTWAADAVTSEDVGLQAAGRQILLDIALSDDASSAERKAAQELLLLSPATTRL